MGRSETGTGRFPFSSVTILCCEQPRILASCTCVMRHSLRSVAIRWIPPVADQIFVTTFRYDTTGLDGKPPEEYARDLQNSRYQTGSQVRGGVWSFSSTTRTMR